MFINRRQFLHASAAGLIASSLPACTHKKFFNPDENILLSGGDYKKNGNKQNCLVVINLTQQEKRVIDTPFLPHGICIDPNDKYRVICFEKNGINACEVNLQAQTITRTLSAENDQLFSGHANFSQDGKNIYCIEKNKNNHQGVATVRDTNSFIASHQLPTLGLEPHDCQITNDNKLIVSNTGASQSGFHQPSLVVIDLETEKLVERIKLDDDALNCGHFKTTTDNNFIIASAPTDSDSQTLPGGISIRNNKEKMATTMIEPEVVISRMTGEALSIEINEENSIAAITHPEANLLTFWSVKDKKIIKAYGFENPRGLSQTLDKKFFVVSYGKKAAMAKISAYDLSPQTDSIVQPTFATGEHTISWSGRLREIMPKRIYD